MHGAYRACALAEPASVMYTTLPARSRDQWKLRRLSQGHAWRHVSDVVCSAVPAEDDRIDL